MTGLNVIPKTRHYAIVRQTSTTVQHEGDERSRMHPGHGYPAYSETITSMIYEAFIDQESWKLRIRDLSLRSEPFRAMEVSPVEIELTATVKVTGTR